MKKLLLCGSALATVLIAGAAVAQATPPDLARIIGMRPVGEVAGMPAYGFRNDAELWITLPDGSLMGGYLFSPEGEDIGAPMIGQEAIDIWTSLEIDNPSLAGQSSIIPNAGLSVFADTPPAGRPTGDLAGETMAMAEDVLANADASQRSALLVDLVDRMEQAQTPEAFRLAVVEWAEEVQGQPIISEEERTALREGRFLSGDEAAEPARDPLPAEPEQRVSLEDVLRATMGGTEIILPAVPGETPAAEPQAADGDSWIFFNEILDQTAWFEVGNPDNAPVFVFVDPLCPYSARAMRQLRDDVESGNLTLRVVMAPVVSPNSGEVIAGILLSDDAPQAFWSHIQQYAERSSSDLARRPFTDVGPEIGAMVRANYDLATTRLRGVPFFAWLSAEGPQFLSGVPQSGHFAQFEILEP